MKKGVLFCISVILLNLVSPTSSQAVSFPDNPQVNFSQAPFLISLWTINPDTYERVDNFCSGVLIDEKTFRTRVNQYRGDLKKTPEQKELSEARWNICVQCDEYRENNKDKGAPFCNTCGCPLNKKIFTNKFNECPLKKWEDVDTLLFPATQKTKKSLL